MERDTKEQVEEIKKEGGDILERITKLLKTARKAAINPEEACVVISIGIGEEEIITRIPTHAVEPVLRSVASEVVRDMMKIEKIRSAMLQMLPEEEATQLNDIIKDN